MIKHTIYKAVDTHVGKFVAKAFPTIHPNVITFLGVGTSLVSAYFLYLGQFRIGLGFLLLSGFLDIMDGIIARATGKSSKFGSFLDSATDRFSDYVILIGLLLNFSHENRLLELYLTCGLLPAYALIPYIKAKVESYGILCEVGFAERGERIGILGFGLLTGWIVLFLILLNVATYYTVGQRLVFAYRNIRD